MAKFTVGNGILNYIGQLNNILDASSGMVGKAIYEGAKIVADTIKEEIEAIPIDGRIVRKGDPELKGLHPLQKDGLREGLGIAKMKHDGDYANVKVGFDGYNHIYSDSYGRFQANAMIANSLESGCSFRAKNPFITRAVNRSRAAAEAAMAEKIDSELRKIVKE